MGADIKSLRTRIKSVSSTQQLTRAMGLVASSKIRKASERMLHGRDYAAALEQVLSALTASPEWPNGHPFSLSTSLLVSWTMGAIITLIAYRRGKWRQKAQSAAGIQE